MTTGSDLVDLCEADLADSSNTTWSASDILQWVADAVNDYSLHFKRQRTQTISASDDDRTYDLNADVQTIVSVEYPSGEDPPQYLQLRSHTHPDFWIEAGYYDHIVRADDSDVDEIWISEKPSTGESIVVLYLAHHVVPAEGSETLTVPDEHLYILRNYVLWRAALQLKTVEEVSPTSNSSLIMSQLAVNVDRLRRAYVDSLAKALYSISRSKPVSWGDATSESSRIY